MSSYYTDLDNDIGAELEARDNEIREYGITCERCGKRGFEWGKYCGQSRLFDRGTGDLHICAQPLSTLPKDGVICKYCGEKNLHWKCIDGKWRTYESNGKIHRCLSSQIGELE